MSSTGVIASMASSRGQHRLHASETRGRLAGMVKYSMCDVMFTRIFLGPSGRWNSRSKCGRGSDGFALGGCVPVIGSLATLAGKGEGFGGMH